MPTGTPNWPRLNWSDPNDRRQMILSGVVWKGGSPKMAQDAANECLADPSLINDKMPPDVRAWIDEQLKSRQDGWA